MVKQEILDNYFPEYQTLSRILDKYSEYELGLLEEYPDDINDLEEEILKEVQWDILYDVISEYIGEEFYHSLEMELMEYFLDGGNLFITHNASCNSYCLSHENIVYSLKDFVNNYSGDTNISGDIVELVNRLNSNYPIKFIYD
ncbi:MAG: hypothetical protein ACI4OP_03975 [Candidatus Coprovivens sp.]